MARLEDENDLITAHLDESDDEEDVIDDFKHSRLLESIGSLDGKKRIHQVVRAEPSNIVSEFHVTTTTDKVGLHDLISALKSTATHGELKKKLNRIRKKKKVVGAPLPKGEQEKIKRVIAYEQTTTEVSKWDPIVEKNRTKDQISFPLQKPDVKLKTAEKVSKRITPFTSLELEVAAALQGNTGASLNNEAKYTEEEEKALKAMSLEEAKERRAELQRYRALLSYAEGKARRQKKIKSKKYHRVMRKAKDKNEKKRLEELEKSDPERFLEELDQVDKDRIQERMSLKHRGGSKFMKRQKIYAKYDDKARQSMQDMIDKNKELTRKMAVESSSDEEETAVADTTEADPITPAHLLSSSSNPWLAAPGASTKAAVVMKNTEGSKEPSKSEYSRPKAMKVVDADVKTNMQKSKTTSEAEIELSGDKSEDVDIDNLFDTLGELEKEKSKELRKGKGIQKADTPAKKKEQASKATPNRGKQNEKKNVTKNNDTNTKASDATDEIPAMEEEDDDDALLSLSTSRKRTLEDMDDWSEEETERPRAPAVPLETDGKNYNESQKTAVAKPPAETHQIDPKKFLTIETKLKSSQLPDVVDENDDDEEQHRMTISEAFASDDVVAEFNQEKRDLEDKEKIKDIDLSLPGWGAWGGGGNKPNKEKKKKFIVEAPDIKRKDRNLSHVIISEVKDTTISKHQVNKLPHYFRSVHQFESSIRAPVGKTWNPETSYRDLIKPKVVTEIGKIIEPIDKSEVYKKQQVKAQNLKKAPEKEGKNVKQGKNVRKARDNASPRAKRQRKK